MKTGMNASMTPGLTSMSDAPLPSWNTSTMQPVGGTGREQVEDDRLDRDDDRVEGDEQQQERQAEHEQEHLGHPGLVEADDVERVRRVAGDVDA